MNEVKVSEQNRVSDQMTDSTILEKLSEIRICRPYFHFCPTLQDLMRLQFFVV